MSWLLLLALIALPALSQTFKASPTDLTFNHQVGASTLPVVQTVAITGGTSASPLTFTAVTAGGNWLTVTPVGGTTPVSAKVSVNPSTLAVGTYAGTITITPSAGTFATVTVTMIVKAAPPTLTPQPSPITFNYRRGDPAPAAQQLKLSTSGALVPFNLTGAGGSWFTIAPKSGVVFPAFPAAIGVTVNPSNLAPGSYRGTITISAPQAANKSQAVTVALEVGAGPASLDWIFPSQVVAGSVSTIITLSGNNFYGGTVVRAGSTAVSSTLVGPNVMTAVVPASMLSAVATLGIVASNPGADGGDSSAVNLGVVAAGPAVMGVANAASYAQGSIGPGEMVVVFGNSLGPDTLTVFTEPAPGGTIATTLATTRVLFDTTAAPVIYTMPNQVAAMAPYDLAGKATVSVRVEYSAVQSAALVKTVANHAPGLFTAGGAGAGQAAALNFDETTGAYSLNSETALAAKGTVVILYATGEGVTMPASIDGSILTAPSSTPNAAISVQVGGKDATVLYSGGVPGLVAGMLQVNARLATDTPAGKAVPVVLTINGVQSQPAVTIGVK